jgi:hypothetical protein
MSCDHSCLIIASHGDGSSFGSIYPRIRNFHPCLTIIRQKTALPENYRHPMAKIPY